MSPHFTVGSFIIPYVVFIFGLYLAAVPERLSLQTKKSSTRVVLCCLGGVFGLYFAIKTLIDTRNDMTGHESYHFLVDLAIFSWCMYSLFTNHSNLPKGRKIAKAILYWLITGLFLSASAYDKLTRDISLGLNMVFAIIAYYTVCDREIKESPSKKKDVIKDRDKLYKHFTALYQEVKRIMTVSLNHIQQYYGKNKKIILITIIIIVILWLLPFYVEYFIDNSGIRQLFKRRYVRLP